jgi:hypothetical protein
MSACQLASGTRAEWPGAKILGGDWSGARLRRVDWLSLYRNADVLVGGLGLVLLGIAMGRTTFGLLLILSGVIASIQQPATAVVVCTGPGVPSGCVVRRPRAVATPGVGAAGYGAPGVPAAGAPGYGAAGRGANVNGGVNRAGPR